MENVPTSIKAFVWSLVAMSLLGSALLARELGVTQWVSNLHRAMVVASSQTTQRTQPVLVVIMPQQHTAPTQQVTQRNTNQIVLAGGQTVGQADLFRLMQQRDSAAQQARAWQRAYEQLQQEAADNCTRNTNLRSCQLPGHQEALRYVP